MRYESIPFSVIIISAKRRSLVDTDLSEGSANRPRQSLHLAGLPILGPSAMNSVIVILHAVKDSLQYVFLQMASQLYVNLTNLVEAHVKANIEQFLSESMDRQVFLKRMDDCWRAHCRQMIMIRSIFLYLDRTYVLQNPSIHSIW